jgi:hypothetical protein
MKINLINNCMKRIIVIAAVLFMTISSAYSQSLKSISATGNKISLKETHYTSLSLGASVNTKDFKEKNSYGFNFGLRHQFSRIFYFEGRFSFVGQMNGMSSDMYVYSLIPQWNAFEEESLRIMVGTGLELLALKDGGYFLPLGLIKLEYNISKEFFVAPEIKAYPFSASLNFGFRFPFKGYENAFK